MKRCTSFIWMRSLIRWDYEIACAEPNVSCLTCRKRVNDRERSLITFNLSHTATIWTPFTVPRTDLSFFLPRSVEQTQTQAGCRRALPELRVYTHIRKILTKLNYLAKQTGKTWTNFNFTCTQILLRIWNFAVGKSSWKFGLPVEKGTLRA